MLKRLREECGLDRPVERFISCSDSSSLLQWLTRNASKRPSDEEDKVKAREISPKSDACQS